MSRLFGNLNNYYKCGDERDKEINKRLYERNIPSQPLKPNLEFRPEQTKFTLATEINPKVVIKDSQLKSYEQYNTKQVFNPGNDKAPTEGYFMNIDNESILRNQISPLQKSDQSVYIPSSTSDLYKTIIQSKKVDQPHPYLFSQQTFSTFNPNPSNLGRKTFNNSTRVELKDKK